MMNIQDEQQYIELNASLILEYDNALIEKRNSNPSYIKEMEYIRLKELKESVNN